MVRNLLLVSALVLGVSQAWAEGVFMVVKGDIKVDKGGKQTPAKVGMKVMPADTVIAGKDSRAKIVMKDKNVLNISPDSKITIEKYVSNEATGEKNVTLNVLYGKVRSTVNQKYDGDKNKFHVKTPSAVAGVRGTDFITGYQPDTKKAEFITFEGKVEVGQLGAGGKIENGVFVNPGQSTQSIAGGQPQEPKTMPKTELAKADGESKSDGKTDRMPANEDKGGGEKKEKQNNSEGEKKEKNAQGANNNSEGEKKDKQAKSDGPGKPIRGPASIPTGDGGGDQNGDPSKPGPGPEKQIITFVDPDMPDVDDRDIPNPDTNLPTMPAGDPVPRYTDVYRPPDDLIRQTRTLLIINVVVQ